MAHQQFLPWSSRILPLWNIKHNVTCLQQPANSFWPNPEESCLYGTPSLNLPCLQQSTNDSYPGQKNPAHPLTPHYSKTDFNIFLSSLPSSSKRCLLFTSSNKYSVCSPDLSHACPAHPILCDLVTLTVFGEEILSGMLHFCSAYVKRNWKDTYLLQWGGIKMLRDIMKWKRKLG